jgi:hypothetical protein
MSQQSATQSPVNLSTTDIAEFLSDLDAGRFEKVLSAALSISAAAAVDNGKKSKVTLSIEIEPIPGTSQVQVHHTVAYSHPTLDGKRSEEQSRSTPMHVGKGGALSLTPANQLTMFAPRSGQVTQPPSPSTKAE